MKYDKYTNDAYNLYTIETSKFKTVHMEVIFRMKATLENITYASLLSSILMEASLDYPTRKLQVRHLYDLYNAGVYATTSRVGNILFMNVVLDFIDPKYTSKDMLEESIKFLFDMIEKPLVDTGEFDNDIFERVKNRLKIDIEALKEDAKQSSIMKAFRALDKNDVRSFNITGDLEILESITPKKLYKFYQNFIEHSLKDVYIVGGVDMKTVDKLVRKYATFNSIQTESDPIFMAPIKCKSAKTISENSSFSQTNLVGIYTLGDLSDYEVNYVLPLFNMLFGSGSLESKLYKSLRVENSLCYNVTTFYQKYDASLIVHTAIDDENVKFTQKLINNALGEFRNGNFTLEELDNVKNLFINSLYLTQDSPNRLVDLYLFQNIAGLPSVEDRIDEIKNVSKSDIIAVAKKLKPAIMYALRGEAR